MKNGLLLLLFLCNCSYAYSQKFGSWKGNQLTLSNGLVTREITVDNGKIFTGSIKLKGSDMNFAGSGSNEFSFLLNGKQYNGASGWRLHSFTGASDDHQGSGATVNLEGTGALQDIVLAVTYLLYPDLPVIRKQIKISNRSGREVMIESLDIEKIQVGYTFESSVVYTGYGRNKHLSTYIGNWDDPVMAIHSHAYQAGLILGNESPGVLKRIDYNVTKDLANIGLTHTTDMYPFRKYIRHGDSWTSPRVFVLPYLQSPDPSRAMNNELAAFVRRHMGVRLFENRNRPLFMYNNYNPFGDNFNDTLLISLSKAAAESGIRQFQVDCGWHTTEGNKGKQVGWLNNMGDWIADEMKFPHGMKPVFDAVQKSGMGAGLWMSVGSAASTSKVFKEHPEWAIRDAAGRTGDLHMSDGGFDINTMCMATGWMDYIKSSILEKVRDFNVKFVKLDLTVVTSAYLLNAERSGCYAPDHDLHKDHKESFIVIYERLFELFDELHKEVPDLYIDCTFETAGRLQLVDFAFLEHAEGNWLTNITNPYPTGAFRVRELSWWKSPAIPASSLLIGNLSMDSPDFINELKSLIGSFPIVLGDPRKLSKEKRAEIRQWADWLATMRERYDYDLYRQDLPGFGQPTEGSWDAWSRINSDTKAGGIVGVFRENAGEDTRRVVVPGLVKNRQYLVKLAPTHQVVAKMTGAELEENGFKVSMNHAYDSKIFEIALAK